MQGSLVWKFFHMYVHKFVKLTNIISKKRHAIEYYMGDRYNHEHIIW